MYACETCDEEFETLSRMRLRHDPCPVAERRRKRDDAIRRLKDDRNLEIGDLCRVIATGDEVKIVGIESNEEDGAPPTVVWVPAGTEDGPKRRRRSPADAVV